MPNIYMNEEGEQVAQSPLGHALIEPPQDHTIEYEWTQSVVQGSRKPIIKTVRHRFVFSQALQDDRIVNERRHMLGIARIHLAQGVMNVITDNAILYEQKKADKVEELCKQLKKDELIYMATTYHYDVDGQLITTAKLKKMTKAQIASIIADCFFKREAEKAAVNQCELWDKINSVSEKIAFVYGKTGDSMRYYDDLTDREKEVIMSYLIKEGEEE